jgi:hypothetical protein
VAEQQKQRKTPQEVAQENLVTAERVHEKAKTRLEKAEAAVVKAREDVKFSERKVRAARMIALDEETASAPVEDDNDSDVL